ncbi:MAG: helix-turn-helix domain-containing protein [Thermodesulfobacteriota bacterium]
MDFNGTVERMLLSGNLRNKSAIARKLGITPQAISNYRKRDKLPSDLVIKFAGIYSLSVDWLLTGEGRMYRPEIKENNPLLSHATNKELLAEVKTRIEANGYAVFNEPRIERIHCSCNEPTM